MGNTLGVWGSHTKDHTYLPGEIDPAEFDFNWEPTREQLLVLYQKSEILQLQCYWSVEEAVRKEMKFEQDQQMTVDRHGKPYTFGATAAETEIDEFGMQKEKKPEEQALIKFLRWMGFFTKLKEGLSWSRLFGNAIAVMWDDKPGIPNHVWVTNRADVKKQTQLADGLYYAPNPDSQAYVDFDCYYEITFGNGYEIADVDDKGNPTLYKIHILTQGMEKKKVSYVHADRVVQLNAPRKSIVYGGSSAVRGLDTYALASQLMIQANTARAQKLAGSLLSFYNISSQEEAEELDTAIGSDLTSLDRLFFRNGKAEGGAEFLAPDLKASDEFLAFFEILSTVVARFTRISKQLMDGDPEGARASANVDTLSSYTCIKQIQSHYKRAVEDILWFLGVTETAFEWNEIIPELQNDFNIGLNNMEATPNGGATQDPKQKENNGKEDNPPKENQKGTK